MVVVNIAHLRVVMPNKSMDKIFRELYVKRKFIEALTIKLNLRVVNISVQRTVKQSGEIKRMSAKIMRIGKQELASIEVYSSEMDKTKYAPNAKLTTLEYLLFITRTKIATITLQQI